MTSNAAQERKSSTSILLSILILNTPALYHHHPSQYTFYYSLCLSQDLPLYAHLFLTTSSTFPPLHPQKTAFLPPRELLSSHLPTAPSYTVFPTPYRRKIDRIGFSKKDSLTPLDVTAFLSTEPVVVFPGAFGVDALELNSLGAPSFTLQNHAVVPQIDFFHSLMSCLDD